MQETGDISILDSEIKFIDSCQSESLYLHLKKFILCSLKDLSERGLSSILNYHWNDTIINFNGGKYFFK